MTGSAVVRLSLVLAALIPAIHIVRLLGYRTPLLPAEVKRGDPLVTNCLMGIIVEDEKSARVLRYFPRTGAIEEFCLDAEGRPVRLGDHMATRVRRPMKVELRWRTHHGPGTNSCEICRAWHSVSA